MEYKSLAGDHLVQASCFGNPETVQEYFITINAPEGTSFLGELNFLADSYHAACDQLGLCEETLVFARFYLSDIANQKNILRDSDIFAYMRKGAVSTIQQSPVYHGNVSLLVYHIKRNSHPLNKQVFTYDENDRRNGVLIKGGHYDMLWVANFYGIGKLSSREQTDEIFDSYVDILDKNGMNLLENTLRTWVYVRDVDNNYHGMVESRKALFERHGLTPKTRYIASTGIEGFSREVNSLVDFDAFAMKNLKKEQIVSMNALDNLPPTITYGVTFDRGTRVRFGDRSHLHISGTASIDKDGNVMHLGDVLKQTERTIENIKALLAPHGAGLGDLAYSIAYIRNFKDADKVMSVIRNNIPENVPVLLLVGSVCRPTWLVELEGVAILPDDAPYPDFF